MNTQKEDDKETDVPFEKAFTRLEEILEKLNSSQASLEESLTLYDEADKLIASCSKKLFVAEKKIETLIKNRSMELQLGHDQKPMTQESNFS